MLTSLCKPSVVCSIYLKCVFCKNCFIILYLFLCCFGWLLWVTTLCFNQSTMHERTGCAVDFCICWTNKLTPGKKKNAVCSLLLYMTYVLIFIELIGSVYSMFWHSYFHYLPHLPHLWVTRMRVCLSDQSWLAVFRKLLTDCIRWVITEHYDSNKVEHKVRFS